MIKLAGWPTFKQNYQGRMERGFWEEIHFITHKQNIENTETNSDWQTDVRTQLVSDPSEIIHKRRLLAMLEASLCFAF